MEALENLPGGNLHTCDSERTYTCIARYLGTCSATVSGINNSQIPSSARLRPQLSLSPGVLPTDHQRLLGHMDLDTREWFDGVLTAAARKVVKEPPEVSKGRQVYHDQLGSGPIGKPMVPVQGRVYFPP